MCRSSPSRECHCLPLRLIFTCAVILSWLLPHPGAAAETPLIVSIVLNTLPKGEFFAYITDDGDFLIKRDDLVAIGISNPTGQEKTVEGERYLSLRSMTAIPFSFSEKTLTLTLNASPKLLPSHSFDFKGEGHRRVYYPQDTSAFINYRADYIAGDAFAFDTLSVAGQVGARWRELLFLSDASYTKSADEERAVRLMSNLTYDRRDALQRWIAGDFLASSGILGSTVNLGGVSFSKIYAMNPYFTRYPTINLSGYAALPSRADVYLDGVKIGEEKLAPGGFELKNLSGYGGAGNLEVVVRDPFGQEVRIRRPFYFTDELLQKGLQEYSFNAGVMRKEFGRQSNRYGNPAVTVQHRFGVSDTLTAGYRGEATSGVANLGLLTSYLWDKMGVINLALAGSSGRDGAGGALLVGHSYQGKALTTRLLLAGYSRDYQTIESKATGFHRRYDAAAGIGLADPETGSILLDLAGSSSYDGQESRQVSVTYSKNLSRKISLTATYRRLLAPTPENDIFLGLTYLVGADANLLARLERSGGATTEAVVFQKNPPLGEGVGYRLDLERSAAASGVSYLAGPSVRYNGRHGIYEADIQQSAVEGEITQFYRISASGALALVGGHYAFTRPVTDSFGVVKVADLEGIRVYQNSQEIGRTDATGTVFLPNLNSFYDNQLSIRDQDVPIDYSLSEVLRYVSPPLRSGSCVNFRAMRTQPVVGTLLLNKKGTLVPLEYADCTITVDGRDIPFPTGQGGEFYLDFSQESGKQDQAEQQTGCTSFAETQSSLKPGSYYARVAVGKSEYRFTLVVPPSREMLINLGSIVVQGEEERTPPQPSP